jgi:aminoglycoside 6'-N-acetyltransferase
MLILRPATPADRAMLERWDEAPHVVVNAGDDGCFDWAVELPLDPDWREFLVAELDGRPIGFIQIIDPAREESHYWGEIDPNLRAIDIWIGEADAIGQGHGTAMMRLALARCFAAPEVQAVLVDPLAANSRAHHFYQRLGFSPVEHRRFGSDDCLVHRLDRQNWEKNRGG